MSASNQPGSEAQDDEDDYMNMTFEDAQAPKETSLQRTQRLKKEARARGLGIAPDAKAPKLDPDEYRERVRKEREDARLEQQFFAAQRLAERMDDERSDEVGAKADADDEDSGAEAGSKKREASNSSRPLKSVSILYRGLVRHREEKERDRRMRHDLEQSLSRLPTYEEEDDDPDYKTALGKAGTVYTTAEDLDEEDPEQDEFDALDVRERLERLLKHLREQHRYCFWCKMAYPDAEMDGCPGLTEEEHD
ncbi:hypothetical protein LLEC1_07526 [Akanthomyces lecanii]|uniref:DUF4187 domain-containing protein n=1 Tax=Cordyceps confragosa TaxID=2714763 RepID=A0A179HZM7_CORDF|nr:hypothetical protein LLEC1_07526 [Akanthomyces lecanii]